jgi:hypothetical protein
MGRSKRNNTFQFASWISAERRWGMTGTPTKQSAAQINQLHGLLNYLTHEFFLPRLEGEKFWKSCIAKSWRDGCTTAFFRLLSLFSLLMKHHTKLDIEELIAPSFKTSILPMSFVEVNTYNTLVCAVQSNLLITAMEAKVSGLQDSLLHQSNAKHARDALANVRRVCIGYSQVIPVLTYEHFQLTLKMLKEFKISETKIAELRLFLVGAQEEELFPCSCCALKISTPLLLPCCGELVCPECMDSKSRICVSCDTLFDADNFQLLQPGFELTWESNLTRAKECTQNERQRSIVTDLESNGARPAVAANNVNEQAIVRLPQHNSQRRKFGDGHDCKYDFFAADGVCMLCRADHDYCILFNEDSRCKTCHKLAQKCPEDESKASYLVGAIEKLYNEFKEKLSSSWAGILDRSMITKDVRPFKAIVFSQFREPLNVIGTRLLLRFGSACIAEYFGKFRKQELSKFVNDKNCFCMLLSKDGSEGLDLSFVTHIFFLEEILDKSLQDQAIARAWRMGATGRVEVETLIAKNSVEETMLSMETSSQKDIPPTAIGLREQQQTQTKFLLQSLRLNTDYHQMAGTSSTQGSGVQVNTFAVSEFDRELSSCAEPKLKKVKFYL